MLNRAVLVTKFASTIYIEHHKGNEKIIKICKCE